MGPYRLGDLLKFATSAEQTPQNSLARAYWSRTDVPNNFEVLAETVISTCAPLCTDETIMHLRLGDALATSYLKPPSPSEVQLALQERGLTDVTIMSAVHNGHAETWSKQAAYVGELQDKLPYANLDIADHTTQPEVDADFCRMVNAKSFIEGRGGFSEKIRQTRCMLDHENLDLGFAGTLQFSSTPACVTEIRKRSGG